MKRNFEAIFHEIKVQELKTADLEAKQNEDTARFDCVLETQQAAFDECMKKLTRMTAVSENLDNQTKRLKNTQSELI